jgi:sugar lactone lactonase YvrE
MKLTRLLLPLGLLAGAIAFGAVQASAKGDGPPPTSGDVIATDLGGTQGATIGPDGALYVADGGTGGPQKVTTPDGDGFFGLTGRVSRIDPVTGERTTFAMGIPSGAQQPGGPGFGVADIVFLDGDLYYLITGGFTYISPDLAAYPNGVYRIENDGSSKLIANISKFNDDNPVTFPDANPGGNPFGITARNGELYVTDGNYNRVLHITTAGKIDIVASFENVVTTGITATDKGPLIVTEFGGFPFDPASGKVMQVGVPTGNEVTLAAGYSHIISAAYGPGGKLYALSMGDQADPSSGDEAVPFTGKILLVNADGTLTPIVDGLMLGTSLDISGDTAYVTSLIGEVYQINDLSSIASLPVAVPTATAPAAPEPTATPRTGVVTPPNTGAGPAGGSATTLWALALGTAVLGAGALGAGAATKRR